MNEVKSHYLRGTFFAFFGRNFVFECGDGWFELIKSLCEKLDSSGADTLSVSQVKEKCGGLRFYVDLPDAHTATRIKVNGLIAKAEKDSFRICEICGKDGQIMQNGLKIKTRCENCSSL